MIATPSPTASFLDLPARALLETLSQLEQTVLVVDRCGRIQWMSDSLGLFCERPWQVAGYSVDGLLADPERLA